MTAEDSRGATHASFPSFRSGEVPWEDRRRTLERERETCLQRIARLRAEGVSGVSLLHWLERLQACEAELALLDREEARPSRRTWSGEEAA